MKNIVLVGFMGTGKTTVGRLLARQLGWRFVDLDREIEAMCCMEVSRIFAKYGEPYFREQETAAIKSLTGHAGMVVATGGGAVLRDENISALRQCGIIVMLSAQPDVIVKRLEQDPRVIRPLLQGPDKLQRVRSILADRQARYALADVSIDTDHLTPTEVVQQILRVHGDLESKICRHSSCGRMQGGNKHVNHHETKHSSRRNRQVET